MHSFRMAMSLAIVSLFALAAAVVADDPAPKPAPARGTTRVPPSPRKSAAEVDEHAGHDHGLPKQEAYYGDEYYPDDQAIGNIFADKPCPICGGGGPSSRCFSPPPCCCGTLCYPGGCGRYVRADLLLWSTRGMQVPTLVTTGNPASTQIPAGVINEDGSLPGNTAILFGNGLINSQGRTGGRIVFGQYLNPCWAVEGEYFALADQQTAFRSNAAAGNGFVGIPFFDESNDGLPAVFTVAPGAGGPAGSVNIDAVTRFQGAGVRVLRNLCCWEGCGPSWWDGCPVPVAKRFDFLMGYRFNRLDDSLIINQTHDILGTTRIGRDVFDTENQFNGLDLGTMLRFRRACWSLDLITKVGIGNTRSVVLINGVAFQNGVQQTPAGSILAVSTNSGRFVNNSFTMLPEIGLNVGYQINPCWRFTTGYTLMYWCGVYRPGDQIDQHINPNLWPPLPLQGNNAGLWPQYPGRASDFWAQGVNFGLEARW